MQGQTSGHNPPEADDRAERRQFLLTWVQPGLAGLMDGSVSTLAPIFTIAFATRDPWTTFLVGLSASVGAGISMGFTEAVHDDGKLSGRGAPWRRGLASGVMTTIGGLGHALPYLIPSFWTATVIALIVVFVELGAIVWIQNRFMETPFVRAKQNDFYFVTTGNISTSATTWLPSRLWRLRFDDIANPEAGGTIEMLLTNAFYPGAATTPDDDPNYQMLDNMGVDGLGRIVLQEDTGGNNRLGRIYVYGIDTGNLVEVARHNAKFFGGTAVTNPNFLTNNEESSGVIDASSFLGAGWFLMSVQSHRASSDAELVEGGQLMAMFIDPSIAR